MSILLDSGMNLYDANKQLLANEKPLDPMIKSKKIHNIADMINKKTEKESFYMLLCRERNDYTLFNFRNPQDYSDFINDFNECLYNRGEVLAIDEQESGAWEIWLRDTETEEIVVYYFFDYNLGVLIYE